MKSQQYLQSNPILKSFVDQIYAELERYFTTKPFTQEYWEEIKERLKPEVNVGTKFVKILVEGSVWGFIAKGNGVLGGVEYKKGDLLKAASWKTPAPYSRGNIIDGTANWGVYGPNHL